MNIDTARTSSQRTRNKEAPWTLAASRCQICAAFPCKLHPYLTGATLETLSESGTTRSLLPNGANAGIPISEFKGMLAVLIQGHGMAEHHSPDGSRTVLHFFRPGDIVYYGGMATDQGVVGIRGAFVFRPLNPVRLCLIPEALLRESREIEGMLEMACNEICALHTQQILLGKMPAYQRLAYFLFHEAARSSPQVASNPDAPGNGPIALVLPMVRADIADYLGVNLETVSRCFTRLRKDGMIALPKPNTVVIPDPAALRKQFEGAI